MNVSTPLSKAQECKVVQYVEDTFMDITSAYKKRSEPSMTKLPTLSSCLYAMQSLLAFILRYHPRNIIYSNLALQIQAAVAASAAHLCIYGARIDRPRFPDIHCYNTVRQ
ncbi:hypothetical protein EDD17DRAFT_1679313 [Pisolithus thermaeus]|nr:hypothetical protein EDD17DRAFT_1679313 [Pisolithus thermaeus]